MQGGFFYWLGEEVKAATERVLLYLLRSTSQFESELTNEGREEQRMWRDRRRRDLRGLVLRSLRRFKSRAT